MMTGTNNSGRKKQAATSGKGERGTGRKFDDKRHDAADFLKRLFAASPGTDSRLSEEGHKLLMGNSLLREALLIQRNVVERLARVADGVTTTGLPAEGARPYVMRFTPLYLLLADWPEFLDGAGQQALAQTPTLEGKLLVTAGRLAADVERSLESKTLINLPKRPEAALIGLYASSLGVHGRYKRALALLHWLDDCRPGMPDTAKRLANICWAIDNQEAAIRWQRAAIGAAPSNSLLHLSMAVRMSRIGRLADTHNHLELAEQLWPGLELDTIGQV